MRGVLQDCVVVRVRKVIWFISRLYHSCPVNEVKGEQVQGLHLVTYNRGMIPSLPLTTTELILQNPISHATVCLDRALPLYKVDSVC